MMLVLLTAIAYAEEPSGSENERFRIAVGAGIPYGAFGSNVEASLIDSLALTGGFGISRGGTGWAVGGRVYPFSNEQKVRPRLSAFYGTVATLEKKDSSGDSEYKNDTGAAYGVGFDWRVKKWSFDFDLFYVDYSMPEGYEKKGSDVKVSLGYGYHF
jgi:hypothetical protein